jgi:hypothetical protein
MSPAFGVLDAVDFALVLQDLAAVGQSVQGRSGEAFAAEHFGPTSRATGVNSFLAALIF